MRDPFGAAPDDFDHPDHEQLVSLVDNRIDEIDREWILGHVEICDVCKVDIDDLMRVKASLETNDEGQHTSRWVKAAIGLTAAAGVVLAIWIGAREPSPEVTEPATATVASATAAPTAQATPSSVAPLPPPVEEPIEAVRPVLTEAEQGRVARALASGRMELPPNMSVLRGHEGTLLGPAGEQPAFRPTSPVATALTEARPQFSWTPKTGATRYTVTVVDERFRQVVTSGPLKTTTWKPSRDLPRGRVLQWQVSAISADETAIAPAPPQPEARFMVLDQSTVARLAKERQRLATEPIALGLVLAKAGLFAEADSVFQSALTDARFDRSQVRALLARLRAR